LKSDNINNREAYEVKVAAFAVNLVTTTVMASSEKHQLPLPISPQICNVRRM